MVNKQYIYQDNNEYFLIEIWENKVTLKVKRDGWSDIWSLPLQLIKENE
jgi:hypothetical protein